VHVEFKLGALERDTIAAALDKARGNISLAARMLGVSRAARAARVRTARRAERRAAKPRR
jgi:transcriptional regulator of acetoin/glycerol metabolism